MVDLLAKPKVNLLAEAPKPDVDFGSPLSVTAQRELNPQQQQELLETRQNVRSVFGSNRAPDEIQSAPVRAENTLASFRFFAPESASFARDLPEFGEAEQLNRFDLTSLKSAVAGNLITNEAELAAALKTNIPGSETFQDPEGKAIIKMPDGEEFAINKPGLSGQDFAQGISRVLAFFPAGKLQGAARTAAGAAATETVLQGAEAGVGGEFDPQNIGTEAALSAGAGVILGKLFNRGKLTPKQQAIARELEENPRNPDFAKFLVVDGRPEVSKKLRDAAKKLGGDEGNAIVAVAKNATPQDKSAIRKMVDIIKRSNKDPLFKDTNKIGDVVGNSLRKRVLGLKAINRDAGKRIDSVARTQLKGKPVNIDPAVQEFRKTLADKLRVSFDDAGGIDFSKSALSGSNAASARNLVEDIFNKLRNQNIDASDAHFLKRFIDNQVTFGKSQGGLSGDLDSAIKGLRANINTSIRDVSDAYTKANVKYADSITAIDNLQTAAGTTLNLDSSPALGTALRRLTNNSTARAKLLNSLDETDTVARRYGINFKDDILTQNNIANALEKRFATQGSTTLRSEIGKGASDAIQRRGIADIASQKAGELVERAFTATDDEALDALLAILD